MVAHLVLGWWVRVGLLLLAAVLGSAELRLPERRLHLPILLLLEMRWRLHILVLLRLLHIRGRMILPAELLLVLLLLWRLAEGRLLELLELWWPLLLLLLLLLRTAWLTAERLNPTRLPSLFSEWLEAASA